MTLKIRVAKDYLDLSRGHCYYLLPPGKDRSTTRLLTYVAGAAGWYTKLVKLKRFDFEEGLHKAFLILERDVNGLPPYLDTVEATRIYKQLEQNDSPTSRVCNERLKAISPLIEKWAEISGAENPDSQIKKYLREQERASNKSVNPTRIRLWYYSYMLHGMNPIVLAPRHFNCGTWSREDRDDVLKKPGPKPKREVGTQYGRVDKEAKEAIVRGFERFASREGTLEGTYICTLIHEFECVTEIDPVNLVTYFVQPEGASIPSPGAFARWAYKLIGAERAKSLLLGAARARSEKPHDEGRASESFMYLMQEVELDGYQIKEAPRAMESGTYGENVWAVTAVCVGTGMKVGIGFSEGAEREEAYRACFFSMAVDKVFFLSLFGVEIEEDAWPCIGLPAEFTTDRGPGANLESGSTIETIVPSFQPMSKSTAEGRHRRTRKRQGRPEFKTTELTATQVARREILRLIASNKASFSKGRLTPEMKAKRVDPSPLGVWNFLLNKGRVRPGSLSREAAVRKYLKKVNVYLKKDGIWLEEQKYSASEIWEEHPMSRRQLTAGVKLVAYVLSMCVRYIWVEVQGQLHMVEMQLPIVESNEAKYLSLSDLNELRELQAEQAEKHRKSRLALKAEAELKIAEVEGSNANADQIRTGTKRRLIKRVKRARPRGDAGGVMP